MYSIAKRYGVTQEAILAANGMKNHNISLGQQLRIPGKGAAVASQSAKKPPVASSVRPVVASVSSVPVSRPVAEAKATNKNCFLSKPDDAGDEGRGAFGE